MASGGSQGGERDGIVIARLANYTSLMTERGGAEVQRKRSF